MYYTIQSHFIRTPYSSVHNYVAYQFLLDLAQTLLYAKKFG